MSPDRLDCCIISSEHHKYIFVKYYIRASEASPTLDCSIEISRDIYVSVCMSVCLQKIRMPKCLGRITWPKHVHAQSQFWAVKTDQ